jgi:hypothetical protein
MEIWWRLVLSESALMRASTFRMRHSPDHLRGAPFVGVSFSCLPWAKPKRPDVSGPQRHLGHHIEDILVLGAEVLMCIRSPCAS